MDKLQFIDLQELGLRLGAAALALILIWIVRRIIARSLLPRLTKIAGQSDSTIDDILLDAVKTPFRLAMIAVSIYAAVAIMSPSGVSTFVDQLVQSLLVTGLFLVFYSTIGVVMKSRVILSNITGIKIDDQLVPFIRTGLQVLVVALGAITVLQIWTDVGSLIAGLGIGGLAFALAAEDTVANLFGFTTIVGDQPLRVGEFIKTPDVSGIVEHVGFRSTRIRQLDQAVVTIPNSALASSVVTNWSRLSKRRLNMTIGVTYDTTSEQMRTLVERLKELLKAREQVDEESVMVLFNNFGGSSLDVQLICYIHIADWYEFNQEQEAIMLQVMELVEELGLGFAFPSQSIYIEQMPQPSGSIEQ
jgi:MscS family membrane protein